MLAGYGTKVSPSIWAKIKTALIMVLIVFLLGVIVRDYHIRVLMQSEMFAFRQGFQQGRMQGRRECTFPVNPI
jgi:hypothetical protein